MKALRIKLGGEGVMDKTFGYIAERFSGMLCGVAAGWLTFYFWDDANVVTTEKYYDIMIKSCSAMFGFLLTVLSLLINGKSETVEEMKKHGSFPRLIHYHKVIVFLSFIIVIYSVLLYSIVAPHSGNIHFIQTFNSFTFKFVICIHVALSVWNAIDVLKFIRTFYRIILAGSNDHK